MILRLWVLLAVFVLAVPWVGAAEQQAPHDEPAHGTYRFDLDSGLSAFKRVFSMADLYLNEYLDLDGQYHPGESEDKTWGTLHFKVYPKGRTKSDEGIDADTWFKSEDGQFSFHFKLREPKESTLESERHL